MDTSPGFTGVCDDDDDDASILIVLLTMAYSTVHVVDDDADWLRSSLQHLGGVQGVRRVPLLSRGQHVGNPDANLSLRIHIANCCSTELDSGRFRCLLSRQLMMVGMVGEGMLDGRIASLVEMVVNICSKTMLR